MPKNQIRNRIDDPRWAFSEAARRIALAKSNGSSELMLDGLGLEDLPETICDLPDLQKLYIGDNRLRRMPECLGRLISLRTLYIYRNGLTEVPPFIRHLKQIQDLSLLENRIRVLPPWLGELRGLQDLWLRRNQITELPDTLSRLTQLRTFDLSYNRLKILPDWLRGLSALRVLSVHGNEALGLPVEVLGPASARLSTVTSAAPSSILEYYFRTRSGARPLNEAKLILLGRGEVGKTALVNRLVHDKFVTTSMTKGIAITQWPVETDKDTVRFHVWDFGGQEIQHATHQFFLTERSLYLVVLNGRAGAEDEDAEYWLKFVKTFGASSPTIVVLNKIKVQPFNLNRTGLKEKYPFIQAFVATDCKLKTNNGRQELIGEIRAAVSKMDNVRAAFPAGWFQIKDRLSRMKKPFISFEEYRKICKELGEEDEQAQERLAGFLDDLGIALNFREDPQLSEETVLNPHWITEGVYEIITSKLLAKSKGELKPSHMKIIFKGKRDYPPRMHDFLIELMRKFELCFPYEADPSEHRYLVPELLGKEKPELKDSFLAEECLNFRYDYRLMPHGLLPRFITRTHTMSEPSERWHTGVALRWERCRALVEADKQERQVLVRVIGETEKRQRLLAVIRENFDYIHAEMKEFRPTEWVSVEGHPQEWINHRELQIFEQRLVSTMSKIVGDEIVPIDVSKMLDDTDVPGVRSRNQKMVAASESSPLKLFISYAHEDEKWRAKLSPNLGLLVREGLVEVWTDLQISAGTKWDTEIKKKMEEADVYLFLMSTDLLNSDYVQKTELPLARKRHEQGSARLIPVVVRKCSWTRYVGDIQGLPSGAKPIKEWIDKDQACFSVEEGLRDAIDEVHRLRSAV